MREERPGARTRLAFAIALLLGVASNAFGPSSAGANAGNAGTGRGVLVRATGLHRAPGRSREERAPESSRHAAATGRRADPCGRLLEARANQDAGRKRPPQSRLILDVSRSNFRHLRPVRSATADRDLVAPAAVFYEANAPPARLPAVAGRRS